MPNATAAKPRGHVAGRDTTQEIPALVRKLVQLANQSPRASDNPAATDALDCVLDIEVDGVRCVLVRSPPETERTRVLLSPREREIARMVAKGYPNKTIAAVLDISTWTVCTHLRRIFAKLGVSTRSAMVASLAHAARRIAEPRNGSSSVAASE